MASQVFSTSRAGTRGAPKGMEFKSRDGEPFPAVLPAARQGAAPHREIPIPIPIANSNSQLPIPNSQAGIELINKGNSGSGLHHPTDQYTQKERGDSNALHPADLTEINRSAKDSFNSPSRMHRLRNKIQAQVMDKALPLLLHFGLGGLGTAFPENPGSLGVSQARLDEPWSSLA